MEAGKKGKRVIMMEKFEHGGNVYTARKNGEAWLDFSANVNPQGLSPAVYQAISLAVHEVIHYPDPDAAELKKAISESYNVSEKEIVLGNGAAELFYLFLQTVRPRNVLLPVPSFSEYERAALAARAKVNLFHLDPEDDFRIDWDSFMGALAVTDCIILGNPNNPTGSLITRNEVVHLLEEMRGGHQWLVVDESFLDFLPYDSRYTVRDLVTEYPNLFVIQSMTKFYALPGLRLGFGTACPKLAQRLNAGKDVWNVNLLAQKAGVAALNDKDYQQQSKKFIAEEMQRFYERIDGCRGIRAYRPSVNFMLLDIRGTGLTSREFTQKLRDKGILVRDCANYLGLDGESYVRIAVRQPAENEQLLAALEEL